MILSRLLNNDQRADLVFDQFSAAMVRALLPRVQARTLVCMCVETDACHLSLAAS